MNSDVNQRKSLLEDLDHWAEVQAAKPWLVEHWTTHQTEITWEKGAAMVHSAAAWIADRVQQPGTRIGTLSCNCAHWIMADLAIMASGNVHVPLFTTMNPENVAYVADFSGIEMLFLGPADNWKQVRDQFPADMPVVLLPGAPEVQGAITWEQIVAAGAKLPRAATPDVNVLATIVFTSGTTGKPKGVMHSLSSLREAGSGIGFESGSQAGWRFLSYLPLAHLGERIVVECQSLVYGGTIYFNEGLATFLDDLRYARPNWFLGVPRIWEKLQQAVFAKVLSAQELEAAKASGNMDAASSKVKAFLGLGDIEYILTSTAPTPAPLKAWYDELGIELYDGYGQSEILPVSANRKGHRKPGSIGQAAHGVEIQIADDGEILTRGKGTAMGYYRAPEITAETFLTDGWVRTGDKGRVDDDGYLFKGKYVAPAPIEGRFLDTNLAEQACLSGVGLAQTVMMLVLSEAAIQRDEDKILAELLDHTAALNATLDKHEQIGALIVSRTPWSHENGVLTHTLKIKRDQVEERFAEQTALAGDRMRTGESLFVISIS
jgi:long-chain acyl-CoA synthetase